VEAVEGPDVAARIAGRGAGAWPVPVVFRAGFAGRDIEA